MFKTFIKLFSALLLANGCCNISYSSSSLNNNTDRLLISITTDKDKIIKSFVYNTKIFCDSWQNQIKKTFRWQSYSRFNSINKEFLDKLNQCYSHLNRLVLIENLQRFDIEQYINIITNIKQQCNSYIHKCKEFYLENKSTTDNIKHWFTYNKDQLQELIGFIQSYINSINSHFDFINAEIYPVNI